MVKKVLVPIADGSEELEAIAIIDVLRRASASVTVASVGSIQVIASKKVAIIADCLIYECVREVYDLIVLPGGMPGSEFLRNSPGLLTLLREQNEKGRYIAGICAAPVVVFSYHGFTAGKRFTCHPAFASLAGGENPLPDPVVVDGNLITGKGAGFAIDFSLKLVEILYGMEKKNEVAEGMALRS